MRAVAPAHRTLIKLIIGSGADAQSLDRQVYAGTRDGSLIPSWNPRKFDVRPVPSMLWSFITLKMLLPVSAFAPAMRANPNLRRDNLRQALVSDPLVGSTNTSQ